MADPLTVVYYLLTFMKSVSDISLWLQENIAQEIGCDPSDLETDTEFSSWGMDSLMAVSLAEQLAEALNVELDPTIFWEFPTIGKLSGWLEENKLSK